MKSLKNLIKLIILLSAITVTTFTVACFYGDLKLSSIVFMNHSNIKFEKRLDDSYERFVASKKQIETIATQTFICNDQNKDMISMNYWRIYGVQRIDRNDNELPNNFFFKHDELSIKLDCKTEQEKTNKIIVTKNKTEKSFYISLKRINKQKRIALFQIDFNGTKEILEIEQTNILANHTISKNNSPEEIIVNNEEETNTEDEYEMLTADTVILKVAPTNNKNLTITSGEISVVIVNKKITEITSLYIEFKSFDPIEIKGSIIVNPLSGQFSAPSNNNYDDGGFISFDGNAYTLNIRFFTGVLQDSLIVFTNQEMKTENIVNTTDNTQENSNNSDQAYQDLIKEDNKPEETEVVIFQNKEEAASHRQITAEETDEYDEEETKLSNNERNPEFKMTDVNPEQAQGFSFEANNKRI